MYQANGHIEHFNQTLEKMLLKLEDIVDWDDALLQCCMAYNTAKHASTGYTPFSYVWKVG